MTPAAVRSLRDLRAARADRAREAWGVTEARATAAERAAEAARSAHAGHAAARPAREAALWDAVMGRDVPRERLDAVAADIGLLREREAALLEGWRAAAAATAAARDEEATARAARDAAARRTAALGELLDSIEADARRAADRAEDAALEEAAESRRPVGGRRVRQPAG